MASFQPFVEQLQDEGIGCSGILQQLDAHCLALKFLNFSDEEEGLSGKVQRALDFLRSYCRGFTAQKTSKERESIEAKAYDPPDLSGVNRFTVQLRLARVSVFPVRLSLVSDLTVLVPISLNAARDGPL